jgi:regulator of sigma E protease
MLAWLWIIPMLILLVVVHEFGHFAVPKWCGVYVKEFAFGFPPRIFSRRLGGTEYSVNLIPLGGYVRLEGEDGESTSPDSFATKTKLQRAAILVAGAAMNVLLVPILLGAGSVVGEPQMQGIELLEVQAGSPAEQAGLQSRDFVVAIDGKAITEETTISDELVVRGGQPVELSVWRQGRESNQATLLVQQRQNPAAGQGRLGIRFQPHIVTVGHSIWQAPIRGVGRTWEMVRLFGVQLRLMVAQGVPIQEQVTGPVGIAVATGQQAQQGAGNLLWLTALLSLNLAIVNLLPFPALDGGRLAVLLLERVRGNRLNPRLEGMIHLAGFALLLTLMVLVSVRDVQRFILTPPTP